VSRRVVRAASPLLAAAVLAACGTTVDGPHRQGPAAGVDAARPSGVSTSVTPGVPVAPLGADGVPIAPGAAGGGSGAAGDTAQGALSSSAAAPVRLGFFISDDASAIYKSLGISGASHTRDQSQRIWQAVIDEVNSRGGLGGHRIVPSYSFIDSESGTNASRAQAACELFTQDLRVFAVVIDGATDISMPACLAKHHTPAIDIGQTSYPYDDVDLRALAPYLYLPGRLSMGRFATYVDELAAQGFFDKNSKVGLLRFDLPNQLRTRRDVIEPALRRHGLALDGDFAFTPVEGTADLPRAANEANAAVLQMRAAGIDRVLFLGSGLSLPYVFPTVAESQGYRPRYGITTDDGPDFMATNAPAAQMTGAMAVGWEPQYDVADSDVVLQHDVQWRSCAQRMQRAGFTPRDGRRCTALYFLEQALRNSPVLSAGALRTGADRIGTASYSTQNYDTFFRPSRFDGVSAVRVLRFDPACTCFRYQGGNRPI
jgi:hypothetical protein